MKKTALLFVVVAMIGCNNTTETTTTPPADTVATATAPAKEEAPPPMDSATMMKKMMEYATPGEMHKMLATSDGKWNTETTMWMDPSKPPTKSTGSCENKMIFGGRYQQSTHKGDWGGMPFEGTSTLAYDNSKKMFVNTWIDNMGTGIMVMEGTYDEATKTMNLKGKMTDCTTGKDCEMRQTYKIVDDKNHYMEMFMTPAGGSEYKTMEMKLVKK
jgi:hypothetical protein